MKTADSFRWALQPLPRDLKLQLTFGSGALLNSEHLNLHERASVQAESTCSRSRNSDEEVENCDYISTTNGAIFYGCHEVKARCLGKWDAVRVLY